MDPFLEDSSAYRLSYTSSTLLQERGLTHWRQTSPPASGLHRFPLQNSAIPEHAPTRLRDWVVRFSPSEGSNGDPRDLGRRIINAELTDQPLMFIHEPTLTILRLGSITRVFWLLPHQWSLATQNFKLQRCNGIPINASQLRLIDLIHGDWRLNGKWCHATMGFWTKDNDFRRYYFLVTQENEFNSKVNIKSPIHKADQ